MSIKLEQDIYKALNVKEKDTPEKLKMVRGANAAFLKDGEIYADKEAGCLRIILLRSLGIEKPPEFNSMLTFAYGNLWEAVYAKAAAVGGYAKVESDSSVECEIEGTDTLFSGRPDHILHHHDGSIEIVETKSVSSAKQVGKVFRDDYVSPNYLAQVVSYMVAKDTDKGRLSYGSMFWSSGSFFSKPAVKEFVVTIDDSRININGIYSGFTTKHLGLHKQLSAFVIENKKVWEKRPKDADACKFCPFLKVCDKYDDKNIKMTDAEFVTETKKVVHGEEEAIQKWLSRTV